MYYKSHEKIRIVNVVLGRIKNGQKYSAIEKESYRGLGKT